MAASIARRDRAGRPNAGDFCDDVTGELTSDGYTLVRRAAALGLTKGATARLLGMHVDTFVDRRKRWPEIDEVFELGRAEADLAVSNALYKKAVSGDMAAIRWYEMTRTDRNPAVAVIEQETNFVVEVPQVLDEATWEEVNSPTAALPNGNGPAPAA